MADEGKKLGKVVKTLAAVSAGGAAGYMDAKWSSKKVAGQNLGTVVGITCALLGVTKLAKSYSPLLLSAGEGMLAYEVGRMAHEKTVKSMTGTAGVGQIGATSAPQSLPAPSRNRVVNESELQSRIAALRARVNAA